MQRNIIVIGDVDWPQEHGFISIPLDAPSRYGLRVQSGNLLVFTPQSGWIRIDGVIWRGQFDKNFRREHDLLSLLSISEVPCINSVLCLLRYGVRATANHLLLQARLPVIDSVNFWGKSGLTYGFEPDLPSVIKVGNWQSGYGKARFRSREEWLEVLDLVAINEGLLCVEPFLEWKRDLRCLTIFDKTVAIERQNSFWKANVNPEAMRVVATPAELVDLQERAVRQLGAQIVGIDWIQLLDGSWKILEANLSPGLDWPGEFDFRDYAKLQFERFLNHKR